MRNIIRAIPANYWTTIPRGLYFALMGKGSSGLAAFGRAGKWAIIAYGFYLLQMETQCATYCCGRDQYDGPGIVYKFDDIASNIVYRIIDHMRNNTPE